MAALEQTGGTEGTAIASTGTGAGGAVGVGWDVYGVCQESEKSGRAGERGRGGVVKAGKIQKDVIYQEFGRGKKLYLLTLLQTEPR